MHIVSKVEKFTFPLAKLLEMKGNFRSKVHNFGKKRTPRGVCYWEKF